MKDQNMKYPLQYGYSLVGRVIEVGSDLEANEWIGRRVFCFAPHGTQAVVEASSTQMVPDDISAEDATFLPSMETAVSLVQDLQPLLGENLGVFGAGLIGSLVAQVLCRMGFGVGQGSVTLFDINEARLLQAKHLCGKQLDVSHPHSYNSSSRDLDCCIEVSGSIQGLQTALDFTRDYGRILLGSWYRLDSNTPPLRLNSAFHRSYIEMRASQVSDIPIRLKGCWNKTRRFDLAWQMIRLLQPSSILNHEHKAIPLTTECAQAAYERLDRGEDLTYLFVPSQMLREKKG